MKLHKISKKITHACGREYSGYLTPAEYLFVLEQLNIKLPRHKLDNKRYMEKRKAEGDCKPSNCWFNLTVDQVKKLRGNK